MKFTITDTALNDFVRITGHTDLEVARLEFEREFTAAHQVRTQRGGAELWKGRRPRRLQFVVHVRPDELVIGRVLPEYRGSKLRKVPRTLTIHVKGSSSIDLNVVDTLLEPGGERRIAFELQGGQWAEAKRGAKLDEVSDFRLVDQAPEWVQALG